MGRERYEKPAKVSRRGFTKVSVAAGLTAVAAPYVILSSVGKADCMAVPDTRYDVLVRNLHVVNIKKQPHSRRTHRTNDRELYCYPKMRVRFLSSLMLRIS